MREGICNRMKTILAALVAALLVIGLAGCGDNTPVIGTVQSKTYKAGHTTYITVTTVTSSGSVATTLVPSYVPECYQLTVHDANENKSRSTCTDPQTYADTQIGDYFEEATQ